MSVWAVPGDATQPNKLGFVDVRLGKEPHYWTKVRPLLAAMNETFGDAFTALGALRDLVPKERMHLFNELVSTR